MTYGTHYKEWLCGYGTSFLPNCYYAKDSQYQGQTALRTKSIKDITVSKTGG